jgi:hypothetical protein
MLLYLCLKLNGQLGVLSILAIGVIQLQSHRIYGFCDYFIRRVLFGELGWGDYLVVICDNQVVG